MFPDESKCYRRLVFDEEEEYLDYIERLSTILEQDPSNLIARNNRGVAYFELGQLTEAASDLRRICDAAGENAVAENTPFLNLSEVCEAQGDLKGAIALATQAIQIDSNDSYAYAVRAGFYKRNGQAVEAKEDRDRAQNLRQGS